MAVLALLPFRSLSPSGRPIPQEGTTGFHLNDPETEVSDTQTSHRDSLQSPLTSTPGSLSNTEVLSSF